MWRYLVMAVLCLMAPVRSYARGPFELNEVSVSYKDYLPGAAFPVITENANEPGRQLYRSLDLNLNLNVLKYGYWDNTVYSAMDRGLEGDVRYRYVSWQYRTGVRITPFLEVGYAHQSQHVLDTTYSGGNPGSVDYFEVKVIFFSNSNKLSIF